MQAATMIGRGSNVVAIAAAISAAFQDSNPLRASSHPEMPDRAFSSSVAAAQGSAAAAAGAATAVSRSGEKR